MVDNYHSPQNQEDRLHRYRARRLRFMINGDKLFNGINYALNTKKIRSFDALLNDLTSSLSTDHLKLCKGVRYIFDLKGESITALTDFQDGNTYLCSSTDTFIMTEYRINNGMLNWLVRSSASSQTPNKTPKIVTPTIKPIQDNQKNTDTRRQSAKSVSINQTPRPSSRTSKSTSKSTSSEIGGAQENDISPSFASEVLSKYDIGSPIGDGHFSVVYCCMDKSNQQFCALKLIDKSKCRGRDDMIYNEVKILKQLNHPNVVKLIEEFDHSTQLYLILELVQDGDLFDAISTVTKFSEIHVATMIHNLSSALTYLHKQGIVHRDIKPENLLISIQEDGSHSIKLADFGLAVEVDESQPLYSVCGTAFYVSPEMLNESGYDYKVDVWSTGVICFILLCGYPPFTSRESESNQDELFDAILAGDFQFAPAYWSDISQHAKNLIKYMLNVNPEKRYTAEQVFKHPWTMGTSSNFYGLEPMNISRKIAMQSSQ